MITISIDVSTKHLKAALNSAADLFLIQRVDILSRRKQEPLPEARRMVAKQLRKLGYSYPSIGRAMNRDHTSIIYMVDDKFRKRVQKRNRINTLKRYHRSREHA